MPRGQSSRAKDCASPREPNLALEKAIPPPRTDDVAPVKSIVPPFRLEVSISAAASRAQSRAPKTPTRHARSKSSGFSSSRLPPRGPPPPLAWFTSKSVGPNFSRTFLNAPAISPGSVRSQGTASAEPEPCLSFISSASCSRYSVERASSATLQPSSTKRRASEAPRPDPTPAMTAIRTLEFEDEFIEKSLHALPVRFHSR